MNVNRDGDWNAMHDHCGATWSGVFYVEVGQATSPTSGLLVLSKPASLGHAVREYCAIRPLKGMLVIFPGWLPHAVLPFQPANSDVTAMRVSISFNLFTVKDAGLVGKGETKRKAACLYK